MTTLGFDLFARDNVSPVLDKVGAEAESTGKKFAGLSGATKALGGLALFEFGKKSVEAFTSSQASQVQLQQAFAKFPALADSNVAAFEALGEAQEKKTKFDHNSVDAAEAMLAQFNLSGAQIQQLTPLIEDYAAKTGKSLPDAAEAVGKAMLGQGRALKDIGIQFTDTKTAGGNFAELMTDLSAKVGGFADVQGKTAAGQTAILGHQFEDLEEKIGAKLIPVLQKLTSVGIDVFNVLEKYGRIIGPVAAGIGAVAAAMWAVNTAQKVWDATTAAGAAIKGIFITETAAQAAATATATGAQEALNTAMELNPIGIVVTALAALGVGLVLAYQRSATFREIVQTALHDVSVAFGWVVGAAKTAFGWLEDHWKIIVAVVFGPMGLALDAIVTHWHAFRDGVMDVWNFLNTYVFQPLIGIVRDGIGFEVTVLKTTFDVAWSGIKKIVSDAWDFLQTILGPMKQALDDVTGPLSKVAGFAGGAASKVGHFFGIGGHAAGTSNAPPGLAWVGENGPELLNFRGGEQVIPNAASMQLAGDSSGDIHFHFNGPIVGGSQSDARKLADFVHDALRAKVQMNARASGVTGFGGAGY